MNYIKFYLARLLRVFFCIIISINLNSCQQAPKNEVTKQIFTTYPDTAFVQESHDAFLISNNKEDNEVRSIAVDKESNVWIATASGIFRKGVGTRIWEPVISGAERGPAYSVVANPDGAVLMGTWNGIYRFSNHQLQKEVGVKPPISIICNDGDDNYALGPNGIWHSKGDRWVARNNSVARSVRDAAVDPKGNLWIGTDAGLYLCQNEKTTLFQNTNELISCYVKAISFSMGGDLWAGGMGGVSIRQNEKLIKKITPMEGLSSAMVNCITRSPDGRMWVGTDVGVVRFDKDYSHSLRFGRRWLTDDKVNDVVFDSEGNAWIATDHGVSTIRRKMITLEGKQADFYGQLMKKHIRPPWTCGSLRLEIPGDTASWRNSDDDNDGEYTSGYLAMESFRYAVTKDPDAKIKARKAFEFLKYLQTVTGTEGFFARSVVPAEWTNLHDGNRIYTPQQVAEELVKDPRYKPVENRWRKSKDGKWLWKGDTSTDEMDGHMMGYFFFYELAADPEEKILIRDHVKKIIDHLIETKYNLIDIDGLPTHWAIWSPEQINHDPDWASERSINSFELLTYLKFAGHLTGDEKYEKEYRRLIDQEGYLENVAKLNQKNPAWQIYFDRTLEGYLFPIIMKYEQDPKLKVFYNQLIEEWMANQPAGENLINNLTYAFATGKVVNVPQTIEFLRDTPLDLVDWPINHLLREDVHVVRSPILEEVQISELPPASERATVRWDKNPWAAVQGDLTQVREPVFWLWPYWMARYQGIIKNERIKE